MKTSRFFTLVRTTALAATLALTTVGLQAQPAAALDNSPTACTKYFEQAGAYASLSTLWANYAAWLDASGYSLDAAGARAQARYYDCLAKQATSNGDLCVIDAPISSLKDSCVAPLKAPSLTLGAVPNTTATLSTTVSPTVSSTLVPRTTTTIR
jgi:hypothetical protein